MNSTAQKLARMVNDKGGVAYFVGGTVRDMLMGKNPKDIDIEVFGVSQDTLETILATFGEVNLVGKAFGVYKVGELDIALPRTETKTGDGHKGFTVVPNPFLPVVDAMRRRDFTINAIYQNVLTGEISDFFGGILDIENKILCVVDEGTFVEDSLRVLRAGQFASRLGFKVAGRSLDLMRSMDLSDLPAERVMGEIEKLLLGDFVKHGLQVLDSVGAIEKLFPELDILRTIPQDEFWHPEGDVWTHTLMVMDRANEYCN
jgi:tRNA nucleotidyltransferase (CCA-adding enzyme)